MGAMPRDDLNRSIGAFHSFPLVTGSSSYVDFVRVPPRRHAKLAFGAMVGDVDRPHLRELVADNAAFCGPGRPGRLAAWLPIYLRVCWAAH